MDVASLEGYGLDYLKALNGCKLLLKVITFANMSNVKVTYLEKMKVNCHEKVSPTGFGQIKRDQVQKTEKYGNCFGHAKQIQINYYKNWEDSWRFQRT